MPQITASFFAVSMLGSLFKTDARSKMKANSFSQIVANDGANTSYEENKRVQ